MYVVPVSGGHTLSYQCDVLPFYVLNVQKEETHPIFPPYHPCGTSAIAQSFMFKKHHTKSLQNLF